MANFRVKRLEFLCSPDGKRWERITLHERRVFHFWDAVPTRNEVVRVMLPIACEKAKRVSLPCLERDTPILNDWNPLRLEGSFNVGRTEAGACLVAFTLERRP